MEAKYTRTCFFVCVEIPVGEVSGSGDKGVPRAKRAEAQEAEEEVVSVHLHCESARADWRYTVGEMSKQLLRIPRRSRFFLRLILKISRELVGNCWEPVGKWNGSKGELLLRCKVRKSFVRVEGIRYCNSCFFDRVILVTVTCITGPRGFKNEWR